MRFNILVSLRVSMPMQCGVRISVTAQKLPLATGWAAWLLYKFLELHRSEANLDSANDDK